MQLCLVKPSVEQLLRSTPDVHSGTLGRAILGNIQADGEIATSNLECFKCGLDVCEPTQEF